MDAFANHKPQHEPLSVSPSYDEPEYVLLLYLNPGIEILPCPASPRAFVGDPFIKVSYTFIQRVWHQVCAELLRELLDDSMESTGKEEKIFGVSFSMGFSGDIE